MKSEDIRYVLNTKLPAESGQINTLISTKSAILNKSVMIIAGSFL